MRPGEIPLSLTQEALWHRALHLPADRPFVSSASVRIDGPIDPHAIGRAVQAVFAAHPQLTSQLVERDNGFALRLHNDDVGLEVIDLGSRPRAAQMLEAHRLVTDLTRTPIDPRTDPVARARLVHLDAERHRLVIAVHPLIADLTSMAMAFDEFVNAFAALTSGDDVAAEQRTVDPQRIRQRREFACGRREEIAGFWAQTLPDEFEPLSLPRIRTAGDPLPSIGGPGTHTPCLIPPRLVRAARALGDDADTSVFMVLLAALALAVHRYGGHRLVPLLVPVDTRRPSEEQEFGAFTTPLPIVAEVNGDMSFVDLVAALRDRYAETLRHSDYPFTLLMEKQGVPWPDLPGLTQVGARYLRHPRFEAQLGELRIQYESQRSTRNDVDLQLEVYDHGDSLSVGFNHSTEIFDAATIARLAGHYRAILESSLQDPTQQVGAVQLLTRAEERQIRYLWNRTATPFPADATVHGLIEEKVAKYPAVPAVSCAGRQLTYAELNAAANRVAHRLRALGAQPGTRVCVLLERSMEMPIALLAILKTGAAYVPLEPDLPPGRIRFTIADTGAPVLVTLSELAPAGLDDDVAVLALDGDAAAIAAQPAENPPAAAGPDDIAYVLYTSGSTGTPKAALIRHVGVVNLINWVADQYALDSDDRVLLKTPYSHDISVPEFFVPLTIGGRLVIAAPDAHRDPDELVDLITREGVTVVHFVPTMLREFLATPAVEMCASLRHVFVGGEALTQDLIEQFSATLDAELHNVYGPTEATDYTTAWEVRPDAAPIAPIGRPIANMRTYVVDRQLRLLPVGVPGELCVAGIGVGAGYHNRPDLTAERFVENPFEDDGGLLYRTGDICMWRADGTLEFIGRDDGQVKIRGHRVEVGEVEAALLAHSAIAEAGVIMREDEPDVKRLVAYLVSREDGSLPSVSTLRSWCELRVPEYAVPSVFIALPVLPRTSSGKLDRRSLPAPGPARPDLASAYVAPRNDAERTLAAIWCEVLGLDEVGVRDSFFELGGDSILAIRIVGRAKRAGLPVSVRSLFSHDTIEKQVSLAVGQAPGEPVEPRGTGTSRAFDAGPPLAPMGWLDQHALTTLRQAHADIEDAYPLTPMQQGMLFHTLMRPGSGDYVEQVTCVVDNPDVGMVERVWVEVLMRHAALRTSVALNLGEPVAIVHGQLTPNISRLDWTGLDEAARRREFDALLARDRAEDFDPVRPPLWRLYLAREDGARVRCVWSHHHLLLDGWSVAQLLDDVDHGLRTAAAGYELEPKPARALRDHAAWLLAQDDTAALAFWSRELEGVRDGTDLGLPQPLGGGERRGRVHRRIERAAIDRFCRTQRVTTSTMLQGAVALLLSRYTGTNDVVFGTVVSGRAIDLEHVDTVIGCLLNTIAVRVDTGTVTPVGSWLRSLQARQAAGHEHAQVALSDVQRQIGITDGHELVRVLLVFEDYHLDDGGQALHEVEVAESADVPVIASFSGDADALQLRLNYERSLFDDDAMDRVAGHLSTLLCELAVDADRAFDVVAMLSEPERKTVVEEFNDTVVPLPADPVHDLVGRVGGDGVALRFAGRTTTYAELNAEANRIAHALLARGAGRDVPVGICMERSPAVVAAQLAVLRSGAAYLPLDPEHPVRRLESVLDDARAPIVIVDAAGRAALAELLESGGARVSVLDLERDTGELASMPPQAPPVEVGLDDLAYVLYTSGSTGEPKGVAQTHRTIVNMLHWIVRAYELGPGDRWLFKTPLTFDVSVPDVFFPLAFGGEMIIAPPGAHADPGALVDLITRGQVTVVQFVPSMLDAFLDHPQAERCVSLRYVMSAGEKLSQQVVERCSSALPGAELHNLYGPTETFYVTDTRCHAGAAQDPPIGRPFDNTRGYVLDQRGEPAPVGVTGELWMAGAGVARGYVRRKQLTAERFVTDPFCPAPGGSMYRTGDRARWRSDGQLEYLGRIDDQVKFHGQRIELGEIEAAIRAHPAVERVAVVVQETAGGHQRLVGYVVAAGSGAPDHEAIAAAAGERLPRVFVPTVWMTVDALPVTAHGKLDRRALPEPPSRADGGGVPVAPRTAREGQLCRLWGEVLGGQPLGVYDDVFAAGADSITSVKFVGRAQAIGIDVDVKTVFTYPTIAGLAGALDGRGGPAAPDGTGQAQPDWPAETALDWPPRPAGRVGLPGRAVLPPRAQRGVLLTGATGFVGAHLLAALLEAGPQDVYALVRAADVNAARGRIVATLAEQRLSDRVDLDRVVVLPGDLERRDFGLGAKTFAMLGHRLDAIVHNGAHVHHFLSYAHLRAANVDGTREAIRLAAQSDQTSLLLVSTTATALALDEDGWRLREDTTAPVLAGGYPESKWVAEQLVAAARHNALPARTIRLPRVMGHTVTGASSPTDAALLLLKGCVELGAHPDWDGWEAWAPVDRVARTVAAAALAPRGAPIGYVATTVIRFADLFDALRAHGWQLEPLPVDEFRRRVEAAGEAGAGSKSNAALLALADYGLEGDGDPTLATAPLLSELTPVLDDSRLVEAGAGYLDRMLEYLTETNFLPAPAAG